MACICIVKLVICFKLRGRSKRSWAIAAKIELLELEKDFSLLYRLCLSGNRVGFGLIYIYIYIYLSVGSCFEKLYPIPDSWELGILVQIYGTIDH